MAYGYKRKRRYSGRRRTRFARGRRPFRFGRPGSRSRPFRPSTGQSHRSVGRDVIRALKRGYDHAGGFIGNAVKRLKEAVGDEALRQELDIWDLSQNPNTVGQEFVRNLFGGRYGSGGLIGSAPAPMITG